VNEETIATAGLQSQRNKQTTNWSSEDNKFTELKRAKLTDDFRK
jgi:hypothetical protein